MCPHCNKPKPPPELLAQILSLQNNRTAQMMQGMDSQQPYMMGNPMMGNMNPGNFGMGGNNTSSTSAQNNKTNTGYDNNNNNGNNNNPNNQNYMQGGGNATNNNNNSHGKSHTNLASGFYFANHCRIVNL
jgi:hypothetical protein